MKIVINRRHGGFDLSDEAFEWLIKEKGWTVTTLDESGNCEDAETDLWVENEEDTFSSKYALNKWNSYDDNFRVNKDLVEMVETLGEKASGRFGNIEVAEIPDDIEWEIDDYDGWETIHEKHRSW